MFCLLYEHNCCRPLSDFWCMYEHRIQEKVWSQFTRYPPRDTCKKESHLNPLLLHSAYSASHIQHHQCLGHTPFVHTGNPSGCFTGPALKALDVTALKSYCCTIYKCLMNDLNQSNCECLSQPTSDSPTLSWRCEVNCTDAMQADKMLTQTNMAL